MAAGLITVYLTNGQTLSIYEGAGDAVGTEKRCNMQGTAISTSPFGFTVNSVCSIKDIVLSGTATTEFEWTRNFQRTGKKVALHVGHYIAVNRKLQHLPPATFVPGVRYGALQTVTQT